MIVMNEATHSELCSIVDGLTDSLQKQLKPMAVQSRYVGKKKMLDTTHGVTRTAGERWRIEFYMASLEAIFKQIRKIK